MDGASAKQSDGEALASAARFAERVANYIRYRPSYPAETISFLLESIGIAAGGVVADLGSGTGIWSRLLLEAALEVRGVEPNAEMRQAAESALGSCDRFQSLSGRSDQTGLEPGSVDLITAAQAFHWFDVPATRKECMRILKPDGFVSLLWNERQIDSSEFMIDYEALLQTYATDYNDVNHTNLAEPVFREFYGHDTYCVARFPNVQHFDYEGVEGRLLSCSYVPNEGQKGYEPMLKALHKIFVERAVEGQIAFEYQTVVYCGRLEA